MSGLSETVTTGEMRLVEVGSEATLYCPACRGDNLHHLGVKVFDRAEDAQTITRTEVRGGLIASHLIAGAGAGNPSGRRDGLAVMFECEGCNADPLELTIAQHKGQTLMAWRYTTNPQRDASKG